MSKKINDWPYLSLIVGVVVFSVFGVSVAAYNAGRESVKREVETKSDSSVYSQMTPEQSAKLEAWRTAYQNDPHEAIFQSCLDRVPKDDVIGEDFPLTRRMRFAKSVYDWSYIEMETDVSTDKQWFEISFSSWIQSSPFPYVKGKPGEWGKLMSFNRWPEDDKYKPGTDGRIEWLITPKVEFGRKTLTLQFRCLR
jgi:hypothetical protein